MTITETESQIARWRRDPVAFVVEELKAEPDAWQVDVLRAFASTEPITRRLAMQACAGPGKSTVQAWCGWNFLSCHAERGHHPNAAAISCTADNLRDGLWKELAVWRNRSQFLQAAFEWTAERIFARHHPETWFMSARSFSKTADAEQQGQALSGLHSKFILYLIDESGLIHPAVLRAAEQGLTNCAWGKIVTAGNPINIGSLLHTIATTQRHLWSVFRVTGDPDDPKRSTRIDLEWAREQIRLWGRDNPWVMAYILGMFPPASINALLGPEDVEAAMARRIRPDAYQYAQKRIGIDVAREGDDRTVLFPRQGLQAFPCEVMRTQLGRDIAARVALGQSRWNSELELFDDTGGWAGAAIEAYELSGREAYRVNFSGKAADPRYLNLRAEMWFRMADWVKKGGGLAHDPELIRELTSVTYTYLNGKFQIEDKKMVKKRLGFSPDKADALALTFALPELPSSQAPELLLSDGGPKLKSDWDPLDTSRP